MTGEASIDLYEGAYGLTLRLSTRSTAFLGRLRSLLVELASSDGRDVDIVGALFPDKDQAASVELVARCSASSGSVARRTGEGPASFLWASTSSGWEDCAGLIEGLLEDGGAGHQYLTDDGAGDLLIEVAFRE